MSDGSSIQLKFTDIDGTEVIINLKQSGDTLETSTYIYKTDTVGLGSLVTNLQVQYEVTNYLLDSITLPADISVLDYSQNAIRIYSVNPFQFILTDQNNNIFDLTFLVTIDPSNTYYQVLIHNETLLFLILQHNVEYTITIKQDSIADKTTTITINDNTPFVTGEAYTSDLVNFNDTLTINKFLNDIFVSTNNVSNMMEYLKNNYNVQNISDLNIVEHNNEKIFVTENENIVIDGETISLSSIFNTTIERTTKLRKYIISGYGYNGSGIGSIVVEPTSYALFNYLLDNSIYPTTTDIELSENALIIYSGNSFTFTLTDSSNTITDISSVIENDVTGNFNELIIYDLSILFRDVLHNKTYTATITRTGLPDVTFTIKLKVDKEYDVSEGYTTNPTLVTFADTIKLNNYLYRKYLDNTDLTGMMNNLISNFTVENISDLNIVEHNNEKIFVTENENIVIDGETISLSSIFNTTIERTTKLRKYIISGYGYNGSGIGSIVVEPTTYTLFNYLLDNSVYPSTTDIELSENALIIYSGNSFTFTLTDSSNTITDISSVIENDVTGNFNELIIYDLSILFRNVLHNKTYTATISRTGLPDVTFTIKLKVDKEYDVSEGYTTNPTLVTFADTIKLNNYLYRKYLDNTDLTGMMNNLISNFTVENISDLNIVEHNNEKIFVTENENIVIDGETISLSSIFNTTIERTTKLRKYIISGYGYNGSGIGSIVVEPTTYTLFNYLLDNSVYPSTTDIELSENALIIYSGNSFTFTLTDSSNTITDISSVIENDVTGNFNELIIYDLSVLFRDILHNKTYTAIISRTGLPDVIFSLTLKINKNYTVSEGYTTNPDLVTFADTLKLNNYLYRKYLDNSDLTGMMNNLITDFTVENINNINLLEDTSEDIIFVTENDSLTISGTLVNLENIFNDKIEIITDWKKKIVIDGYGYGGSGIGLITITSVVPCFTGETKILTIDGYKEIKYIKKDDLVLTDKNKLVKVVNVMKRKTKLKSERPYKIEKNHYGKLPLDDIYISPLHAYKKGKEWTKAIYEKGLEQVNKENINGIVYYNLELPDYRNDNLVCSGMVCESWSNKQKGFKWIKNVRTNKINRINL